MSSVREYSGYIESQKFVEAVQMQNVTNRNFYIQKADIVISGPEGEEKIIVMVKHIHPDNYLLSVRNRTGIEAARVYITKDTVLVNDRINRNQYCASPGYIQKKYGIGTGLLPALFGDFVGIELQDSLSKCVDGIINVDFIQNGTKIRYKIDCNKAKVFNAKIEGSLNKIVIEMEYSDFKKISGGWFPLKVIVNDYRSSTTIEIEIKKFEEPWSGEIEFVPGNKYEIINLQ